MVIDFEEKLKAYIHAIEDKSPIEIVPVIVKKAANYTEASIIYGLVIAYIPIVTFGHFIPLWGPMTLFVDAFLWMALAFLIAYLLKVAPFYNRLVGKHLKLKRALQKSESIFLHEGVFETTQRLGILICVFEFEKAVVVLADKGFNAHVESKYWAKLGATLAKDFNSKKPGDEFFEALKEIERDVAPKFKLDSEHKNELSDELRRR